MVKTRKVVWEYGVYTMIPVAGLTISQLEQRLKRQEAIIDKYEKLTLWAVGHLLERNQVLISYVQMLKSSKKGTMTMAHNWVYRPCKLCGHTSLEAVCSICKISPKLRVKWKQQTN